MISKDFSLATEGFRVETSVNADCGFLLTTTSYVSEGRNDVSEIFVSVEDAKQIIVMLEESVKFAQGLKE